MARDFLAALFLYKRRIIAASLTVLLLATALAFTSKKQYEANTSLIVLLGTEYTYRPTAGEQTMANAALEREQVLRTEVEILGSANLHRDVLRRIGIEQIYPELLRPPGVLTRATRALAAFFAQAGHAAGDRTSPDSENSPQEEGETMEFALTDLNAHLTTQVAKTGSTITLSFTHPDPLVAAQVLNTLTTMYLELRRKLFGNSQSVVVEEQVQKLRQQLAEADRRLQDFKAHNSIADFQTRREILLREQGDAEKDGQEAESFIGQNAAKIATLEAQLARMPAEIQSRTAEVDVRLTPLRATVETLRAKRSELLAQYRPDSAPVRALDQQIAAREAELAAQRGDRTSSGFAFAQNPIWAATNTDLVRTRGDLQAAQARLARARAHVDEVAAQLRDLNRLEQQLQELDRARQIAEDSYRSASKVLEDRRLVESVDARKQASVRLLQPAVVPMMPKGTRKLILMAGIAMSLLVGGVVALLSNYFRQFYITAEALEQDLGLPVLSTVPERPLREIERLPIVQGP